MRSNGYSTCIHKRTDAYKAETEPAPIAQAELSKAGNPTEKSCSSHSQMEKKKKSPTETLKIVSIPFLCLPYKVSRSQMQKDTESCHHCKNLLRRLPPLRYRRRVKTSHEFKYPSVLLLNL